MTDRLAGSSTPPAPSPGVPDAPPRKRRRLGRRLTKIALVVALLVFLAPFAVKIGAVRGFIAQKASAALGRRVTIGSASATWWSGIELRDVVVSNPPGYPEPPLLAVDRVHVDVAVLKAIFGSIDASVDVEKPVVSLIRGADGTSNLDGLPPKSEEKPKSSGKTPTIRATVASGRLDAYALAVSPVSPVSPASPSTGTASPATSLAPSLGAPDTIDGITLTFRMGADACTNVDFRAVARGAKTGGGDVPIAMSAALDGRGAGPVKASVPSLDLARVAKALGAAMGLDQVSGSATLAADVTLNASGGATGAIGMTLERLAYRSGEGSVSIATAELNAKPVASADGTRCDVELTLKSVHATGFSRMDGGFDEPSLSIVGTVTHAKDGYVAFGDEKAPLRILGRTISGEISGSLDHRKKDAPEANLSARLSATLSPTLGRLLGLIASPDADLRGDVNVRATLSTAKAGEGGRTPLAIRVDAEGKNLSIGGGVSADAATRTAAWAEPSVTLGLAATWDRDTSTLSLDQAALAAGAITARAQPGFTVVAPHERTSSEKATGTSSSVPFSMRGEATLDADLSRLAGLTAIVPSLSSVTGGRLHASVKAATRESQDPKAGGAGALDAEWSVTGDELKFTPGTLSSRGFTERRLALAGRYEQEGQKEGEKDGAVLLTISRLQTTVLSLAQGKGPIRVRMSNGTVSLDGAAAVTMDLGTTSFAFDRALNLTPTQSMDGRLELSTTGSSSSDGGRFEVVLSGRDVMLPGASIAGTLDGRLVVTTSASRQTTTISDASLHGFGLDVKGSATLSSAAKGPGLVEATGDFTADLASSRPLLGIALGLAPDAVLGGELRGRVDAKPAGSGTALNANATVKRLHYVGARDPQTGRAATIDEPSVVVTAKVSLDAEPGLTRIEACELKSQSLSVSVTGSTRERGGESELDLAATLDGDLVLLAQHLRTVMGPEYADATGEGRVAGKLSVAGSIANGGRGLRISGDLTARQLTANGLTVADAKVTISRPAPGTLLTAAVTSQVNRGTLRADATCDLGRGDSPWTAKVAARGVDTAPLVTAKGAGHALALVLPAILPADATTSVLSGLLDANLDVKSNSLTSPGITTTLTGNGNVLMTKGEVKNSTLFGGLAGGGGGKLAPLVAAVPVVGHTFDQLSRALAFEEMSSVFTIANEQLHLNPVVLSSPSVGLRFTGTVGFDGSSDLDIPLVLGGDAGKAVEKFVKDKTIPLHVRTRPNERTSVVPVLKMDNLGGLVEQGKDLLDGILGGKKKHR